MKKLLSALLLWALCLPANAADNAVTLTTGSGVTMRTIDIGAGVQSSVVILGSSAGAAIYGTAGTANANVLTIQGIASGTVIPVTATNLSSNIAQINAVTPLMGNGVTGTGSMRVTIASDNTANSNPWLVTLSGTNNINTVTTITGVTTVSTVTNLAQMNGAALLMGNGVTGTGSQRVTIASDNTAFTVNAAQSGTWNITNVSGTVSLPTGASTAANQTSIVGTKAAGTAATNSLLAGGVYNSGGVTLTDGQQASVQFTSTGDLKVVGTGVAQGSTTSGQTGSLVMGAVTTAAPTYTTAQTSPVSLDTAGNMRVAATPYPSGATPYTATATGTTGATTATLAGAASVTTYICGFSIRANATAAATGNATVTGVITATLNFTQWTAPNASGLGITEMIFAPCVPASAANTGIAVVSAAPGTGGVVSVTSWGYKL